MPITFYLKCDLRYFTKMPYLSVQKYKPYSRTKTSLSFALQKQHFIWLFAGWKMQNLSAYVYTLTIPSKMQLAPLLHSAGGCTLNPLSLETKLRVLFHLPCKCNLLICNTLTEVHQIRTHCPD